MSDDETQSEPAVPIKNSKLLTDLFGYWPDFHDAEILDLAMSVGCAKPWIPGCESPFLDLKALLCDWNGTNARTLVEMKFSSVSQIELSSFSYQNSVCEIIFETKLRQLPDGRGGLSALFDVVCVEIVANCGVAAKLECNVVEVLSALICGEPD